MYVVNYRNCIIIKDPGTPECYEGTHDSYEEAKQALIDYLEGVMYSAKNNLSIVKKMKEL